MLPSSPNLPSAVQQFLLGMTELSSADPALGRLVLGVTGWLTKIAERQSKAGQERVDEEQMSQADKKEADSLYTLLLETAMHIKPSRRPHLQKHLSALETPSPPTGGAPWDPSEHSSSSSLGVLPPAIDNSKTSSDSFDRHDRRGTTGEPVSVGPGQATVDEYELRSNEDVPSRPDEPSDEQQAAPQRTDETRVNEEQVGASGSEDEESDDRSDAGTLSLSASRSLSSDKNQVSGNLSAHTTQSSVVEVSEEGPAGRTTSLRRMAACRAKSRLSSGKGKLYSPRRRKRRTRGTTDAENLDTIVSKLGCTEVQSAIREAISSKGGGRFNANPLMRSYRQEDPIASRISLFAGFVQSLEKHPSAQWINAVKHRLDVAFFSRFYLSVNQKESDPQHNHGLGAFLEESAALLQLHDRQPTQTTSTGRGNASLVRDRLTEFILLDGRPDTEDTRQFIRSQLDGMQQQGQRWQYLIDHVNLDVLVLLPSTVTAYSMRMTQPNVRRLAELLQLRRKQLSSQVLALAHTALEQIFQPHLYRQDEVFGEDGRWLIMPTSLFGDGINKDDDIFSSIDTGNDEFLDRSAHYEGGNFLPQPDEAIAPASAISSAITSSYSSPEPSNTVPHVDHAASQVPMSNVDFDEWIDNSKYEKLSLD